MGEAVTVVDVPLGQDGPSLTATQDTTVFAKGLPSLDSIQKAYKSLELTDQVTGWGEIRW
ncbi:hypothetical protein [Beijerinckia mobilis]|uniref:hypothetical protein n=1 Tax=Beijerinckia mobilis TaxID=231434 RepID=UPI0005544D6C|nr:hypothetical protein [Beijerinckia mobilis]